MSNPLRVAVLGGGISGLTAAYELSQQLPQAELKLYDAAARLGGVLHTEFADGWMMDHAADNFIVQPDDALKLCEELGVADQLQTPQEDDRRALVVHRGRLMPVPEGLALMRPTKLRSVLASPLLSIQGKLRLMLEPLVPTKRSTDDESLASFVRRRMGDEFLQRIVQPLIAGIYTGNAERLSLHAAMPQIAEMERTHGSLLRATLRMRKQQTERAAKQASGARYGQFRAFPRGTGQLVDTLASRLPTGSVELGCTIQRVHRATDGKWHVAFNHGNDEIFDAVLCALPAPHAARILQDEVESAANQLREIPYASSVIVLVGIREADLPQPLSCFGFVVPACEQREILAASYASKKYPGRAPAGHHLVRVFLGGAMRPDQFQWSDEALIQKAHDELRALLGWKGAPQVTRIIRWAEKMPQYEVGHLDRVKQIRSAVEATAGLGITGNGLDGVGIPQCVRAARKEAKRLALSFNP